MKHEIAFTKLGGLGLALLATLSASSARADDEATASSEAGLYQRRGNPIGLGIGIGAPTGLTLEVELSDPSAIEVALGLDAFDDAGGYAHVVYKRSLAHLHQGPTVSVPFYIGAGGFIADDRRGFDDGTDLGLRVPLGVNFNFEQAPVQAFLELAVNAALVGFNDNNPSGLRVGAYGGARWFF